MDKNAYTTAKYNEKTGFVPMRNNASCYNIVVAPGAMVRATTTPMKVNV